MSGTEVVQEHKCAGCGEQMQFDPETRGLICRGCGSQAQAEEETNTLQTDGLTCPNCGADLTVTPGARQANCEFCGSTFSVLKEDENCEVVGDIPEDHILVVPFGTSREDYQKGMISWLAGEKGTPVDAFEQIGMIHAAEGCYIPHYLCVASYQVNWSASIGYDRIETYVTHMRVTQNGRTVTKPVTRTRVVTDWRPFSSTACGRVTNECPATNFLHNTYKNVTEANTKENLFGIKDSSNGRFNKMSIPLDPATARPLNTEPFDTKYTAGFKVIACDFPATKSYDKNYVNQQIRRAIERSAPGDRIRDLRFNGTIIPDYSLVYVPTWLTVYSYKNKICANHADGVRVGAQFGTRPIDKDQKRLARRIMIPFFVTAALLVIIVAVGMLMEGRVMPDMFYTIQDVFIGLAIFTGFGGLITRAIVFRKSKGKLMEQLDANLQNPSRIFGRKSSKDDPIKELI